MSLICTSLQIAINNATNLLHQAREAGVPRFIFTSSIATSVNVVDPEAVFKDCVYGENGAYSRMLQHIFMDPVSYCLITDWNPISIEMALDGKHDGAYGYMAGKIAIEKHLWKYADEHPEMDITTSKYLTAINSHC